MRRPIEVEITPLDNPMTSDVSTHLADRADRGTRKNPGWSGPGFKV